MSVNIFPFRKIRLQIKPLQIIYQDLHAFTYNFIYEHETTLHRVFKSIIYPHFKKLIFVQNLLGQ
jgi:hypothetical protein